MPKEQSPGKPTTRRYSPEEKAAAVRMVRTLRAELGTEHGTVNRVARQLGYGVESVRSWVRQADIDDGYAPGVCNRVERVRARQDRSNNVVAAGQLAVERLEDTGVSSCSLPRGRRGSVGGCHVLVPRYQGALIAAPNHPAGQCGKATTARGTAR